MKWTRGRRESTSLWRALMPFFTGPTEFAHTRAPRWLRGEHRATNLNVLRAWAARWGKREAFLGLGLGNEVAEPDPDEERLCDGSSPLGRLLLGACCENEAGGGRDDTGGYWDEVAAFYADAAALCRPLLRPDALLVIDTCWDACRWDDSRLQAVPGPLLLDYHHYECMGDAHPVDEHCQAEDLSDALLEKDVLAPPLVIGEFSLALQPESEGYADENWQQRFFERQSQLASQHGAGWFFWNYKIAREGWPHWSFRECVERGWIPAAASVRSHEPSENEVHENSRPAEVRLLHDSSHGLCKASSDADDVLNDVTEVYVDVNAEVATADLEKHLVQIENESSTAEEAASLQEAQRKWLPGLRCIPCVSGVLARLALRRARESGKL
mmetsp:Transcript_135385/g.342556  ORF Transcript_135385/g.342556 Transcript_135385/m.342556 type:complete len:384 (+) Transcript_135385:44-1195(+)